MVVQYYYMFVPYCFQLKSCLDWLFNASNHSTIKQRNFQNLKNLKGCMKIEFHKVFKPQLDSEVLLNDCNKS